MELPKGVLPLDWMANAIQNMHWWNSSVLIGKPTGWNGDFVVAYTSANTLTFSSLPSWITAFTADDISNVRQINAWWDVVQVYNRLSREMSMTWNVLTVDSANFASTDTFIIYTNIANSDGGDVTASQDLESLYWVDLVADNAASPATDYPLPTGWQHNTSLPTYADWDRTIAQYDSNGKLLVAKSLPTLVDLADTTDVAATTHYYPSATWATMDGFEDMSLSGKFIDADWTLTLTVEATNDEDTASADWIQVYGYDDKNDVNTNSWTITNGTLTFAISFNDMNYKYYRVKLVASWATNTVIIKERKI